MAVVKTHNNPPPALVEDVVTDNKLQNLPVIFGKPDPKPVFRRQYLLVISLFHADFQMPIGRYVYCDSSLLSSLKRSPMAASSFLIFEFRG